MQFMFLEEPSKQSKLTKLPLVSAPPTTVDDITNINSDDDSDDDMRDLKRPILPSTIHDEIIIPDSLPFPATFTPVLHGPHKKEKERRVTNQEVLKLQAEVLQHQKEMLLLKKEKLQITNSGIEKIITGCSWTFS